jgi:hypothetical protein
VRQLKILELLLLGLWLLIGVCFFYKYRAPANDAIKIPPVLETPDIALSYKGKSFEVRRISVQTGSAFDMTLKDDKVVRVLADLSVHATAESKQKIVDLLNNSNQPRVVLRDRKSDGRWLVDFFVKQNGVDVNVADWLLKNKLVYN